MGGKIFISYRREDDPSAAARVRDALAARFGKASLFMVPGQRRYMDLRHGTEDRKKASVAAL